MPDAVNGDPPQALIDQELPCAPRSAAARRALRPLRVVLLNGAAQKCDGDMRIARLLGNTALQVEFTILRDQHAGERDISPHLLHFYRTFAEVQARTYDALVVAGCDHRDQRCSAPGEDGELAEVIAWSRRQGHAGLVLGAAAYAVLDLRYGVGARRLPARRSGVVRHRLVAPDEPLLRGHDQRVWVPVVDGRGLERSDLPQDGALASLVESAAAGIHILRDASRRLTLVINDVSAEPEASAARPEHGWRAHAQLLFANWLAIEAGRFPAVTAPGHGFGIAVRRQRTPA